MLILRVDSNVITSYTISILILIIASIKWNENKVFEKLKNIIKFQFYNNISELLQHIYILYFFKKSQKFFPEINFTSNLYFNLKLYYSEDTNEETIINDIQTSICYYNELIEQYDIYFTYHTKYKYFFIETILESFKDVKDFFNRTNYNIDKKHYLKDTSINSIILFLQKIYNKNKYYEKNKLYSFLCNADSNTLIKNYTRQKLDLDILYSSSEYLNFKHFLFFEVYQPNSYCKFIKNDNKLVRL